VQTRNLTVPGTEVGVRRALDAVAELWREHGLSRAITWPVDVSLDEVMANIASYAVGPGGERACVDLVLALDTTTNPPACELRVSDDGPAFDPLGAAEPDTTLGIDERPVGGLGISLVRRLMDEVSYERRDGRNHLRLRRRLRPMEGEQE
jgi:anti-sigma regulatory factor (Ser/Thr protein kinase)